MFTLTLFQFLGNTLKATRQTSEFLLGESVAKTPTRAADLPSK